MATPPVRSEDTASAQLNGIQHWTKEFAEGAIKGGFSEPDSAAQIIGELGTSLIPGYGQLTDARDTAAAAMQVGQGKDNAWQNLGLALVGWVPLVGDLLKRGKTVGKLAQNKVSELSEWFYKPKIKGDKFLPPGYGSTDKYGNIKYSLAGSAKDRQLVLLHEKVHAMLSPKFMPLREFRADIRMNLYQRSSLLRYIEEAMAETYAQLKVNGTKGIFEGLRFPVQNGYVELRDVVKEGAIGSVVVGGSALGVYMLANNVSEDK